jgi:hypothetical protein
MGKPYEIVAQNRGWDERVDEGRCRGKQRLRGSGLKENEKRQVDRKGTLQSIFQERGGGWERYGANACKIHDEMKTTIGRMVRSEQRKEISSSYISQL